MSFKNFEQSRQFYSILSFAEYRDTHHIDETTSHKQNNLREINHENH
ncbi:hypothetical protein SBG_0708 [Salmonella bongori NCTC 12419]|uniref:Uncharacterized protein n=1 Tax=Salmonella bongori (strain ATCC 43975 / DSM 13772 / NCTC 12419) TaxID=218493 RepID=A0A0K0H8W5_SALBC|nr:hypothetical protein SBG_0708 [Salmonella bongori NCTC 12419]